MFLKCIKNMTVKLDNTMEVFYVFKRNNDKEGLPQLELFQKLNCDIKCIIDNSLDDTTNNNLRKTYLITKL